MKVEFTRHMTVDTLLFFYASQHCFSLYFHRLGRFSCCLFTCPFPQHAWIHSAMLVTLSTLFLFCVFHIGLG
eukprot:m.369658 g.369658  ORF g.369658 m.369658 type:complete len:72 (+) comp50602_c0_seq1:33-248(+)